MEGCSLPMGKHPQAPEGNSCERTPQWVAWDLLQPLHRELAESPEFYSWMPARNGFDLEILKQVHDVNIKEDKMDRKERKLHKWLKVAKWSENESQSCLTLCHPMDCSRQAPLSKEFSRPEYWSGWCFLLQGIFLSEGLNLGLLLARQILYCHMSHQESPQNS